MKNGKKGRRIKSPRSKVKHKYRSAKFQYAYKLENGRIRILFKVWDDTACDFKYH